MRAVAAGADLNVACSDQAGLELVSDANVQATGAGAQAPVCASAGHVTVLHCACRVRLSPVMTRVCSIAIMQQQHVSSQWAESRAVTV